MKKGILYALITAIVFVTLEPVSKLIANDVNPYAITFWRFLIGSVILLPITRAMLEENGALDEDVVGMVALVRRIEGAVVCATLKDTKEGDVKVSLRSCDDIFDVSAVASVFGGGGHVKASGCLIKDTMEGAETRLLSAIEAHMDREGQV